VRASVIVPTYKEAGNVEDLTKRLFAALPVSGKLNKANVELIFVDDNSRDGSEEKINDLAQQGYNVRIMVRTTERGLSSAVIAGFSAAQGDLLLCMDADLQHPPEVVPNLLMALEQQQVEFVLGSRYAGEGGGVDKSWPLYRRVISEVARSLSRPLTPLSDPMSGFFGIRADVFKRGLKNVSPIGFKIGLELFVKCGCTSLAEVPFLFGVRSFGESKLSGKIIVKYIQQLSQLYWFRFPVAVVLFLILAVFILWVVLSFGARLIGLSR
jgi:dolichol-phosphate mannosyltransferase